MPAPLDQRPRPHPQQPPLRLDSLPDVILLRMCTFLARENTLYAAMQDLPYDLLPLAETSTRMRSIVAATCSALEWKPTVSWRAFTAWLRLSSSHLRTVRIRSRNPHYDDPPRRRDLLPPVMVLSSLAFCAPPLERLDLSPIHLYTNHEASLLGDLLRTVRTSLVELTLVDRQSSIQAVVNSIASARLTKLRYFKFIDLRLNCLHHLVKIANSFHQTPSQPQTSSLTSLHIHIDDSPATFFDLDHKLADACPHLTELTLASAFETPHVVPYSFIQNFTKLHVLTLEDMIIDNEQMRFLLTSLCNLSDLRLESCLILQDDELAGETACPAFLQLLDICAPVLTSMWFPARAFYALEVHRVALLQPRLKRLAITLGLGAADALPTLCNRLKGTLESLRLSGFLVGNFQAELERDQKQIVDAVRAAGKLTSLECFSLILSTATWKNILKAMGSRIQYFYVEVNPSETKDVQFANIVDIIECAALHSRGLRRFSIENNMQYELTASSPLADKLTAAVEKLLRCAPTLSESDLRSLLEVWIPNCESIREERT